MNAAAGLLGIQAGDALTDARAVHPALRTAPAAPAADRAELGRLARWLGRYGIARNAYGMVREAPGGVGVRGHGAWIDITGVAHLYGGEAGLVRDLARRLAGRGLDVGIGLADTFGAAHALAWSGAGPASGATTSGAIGGCRWTIAASGRTAEALAPLPVAGLRLDRARGRLLGRLGLTTIGQLTDLPRVALERRFNARADAERVLLRLDQALGLAAEPRRPLIERPALRVEALFADPLASADILARETVNLVARLCRRLASAHLGVRMTRLVLYRSDGTLATLAVGTSQPTRDPAHLARLLAGKIAPLDLGLGVDLLVLEAVRVEPLGAVQRRLVTPAAENATGDQGGVAALIDRLVNRLGRAHVGRLVPRESHWPERCDVRTAAIDGGPDAVAVRAAVLPRAARAERPSLLLAPPEPIAVMAEVPEGAPLRFTWRRVAHRVVRSAGPERIEPEWWREVGLEATARTRVRDYYRVEDTAGGRFWVFREGRYAEAGGQPTWFLHGVFA